MKFICVYLFYMGLFQLQAYGFLEVFSGDGWVSKCMRANNIPTASFDIRFGDGPKPGKMDPMNLLSDAGFAPFGSSRANIFLFDPCVDNVKELLIQL